MSDLVETSVISSGPISVSVTEHWVSQGVQRGSAVFQGDSVSSRELQFRVQDPIYIFSESTHFQQFILYIRYGPYEGWVPCSASGEI